MRWRQTAPRHTSRPSSAVEKISEIDADRLLTDLHRDHARRGSKWFATAKTLKRFDLAMPACVEIADPKTLIRAARDNVAKNPAFRRSSARGVVLDLPR